MGDPVEIAFGRAAGSLIPRGARVLAAVSGGGDSIALLHLLDRLAGRGALRLAVAHLDHGLRPDSASDAAFVEGRARELGLPFVGARRQVARLRRRDESPEEAARRVRRGFLLEAAGRIGAATIATGHTLDDQAETVLMRLLRGAGPTALTGIAAAGPGPFVRPLLDLERRDVRAWLERRALRWLDDPSNRDMRFDRNRVRRVLMPLMERTLNARAARHLVAAARRVHEDAAYLDELAEEACRGLVRFDAAGAVVVDRRRLADLAPPVANRLARSLLRRAGIDDRRVVVRHVEGLVDLARGPRGRQLDLPGGARARCSGDRLVIG